MPSPTNVPGSAAASGKLWSFGGESSVEPDRVDCCIRPGHR